MNDATGYGSTAWGLTVMSTMCLKMLEMGKSLCFPFSLVEATQPVEVKNEKRDQSRYYLHADGYFWKF